MSKKKKIQPRLRFKDDKGKEFPEWEQKKLGDVATFLNGRAYKQEELLNTGKYKVLRVGNFFSSSNWYFSNLELEGNKYCDKGDLLYAWSASFGPRIWEGEKTIYHYHIWKVENSPLVDKKFLYYILSNETEKMKASSSNGFALLHITKGVIEKWESFFPCIEEQKKIADFLSAVDDKIEKLEKELEELKAYKKGVMQAIFTSASDATERRLKIEALQGTEKHGFFIRFKDENGNDYPDWEKKKLKELCLVKGGKRIPKGMSLEEIENGYPYITVSDMENGSVSLSNIKYVPLKAIDQIRNYKISTTDIYISVAGTLGLVGIIPKELDNANLTENANKLTEIKCDQKYLYHYLRSDRLQKHIESVKTSNAQPKLAIYAINDFEILLPCRQEQNKIASFLSAIDEKINHSSNQIENTRTYKQALLQQLFN